MAGIVAKVGTGSTRDFAVVRGAVLCGLLIALFVALDTNVSNALGNQFDTRDEDKDDYRDFDSEQEMAELAALFEEEVLRALRRVASIEGETLPDALRQMSDLNIRSDETLFVAVSESLAGRSLPAGGGSDLRGPCLGMVMSFGPEGNLIAAAADFDDAAPPIDLLASDLDRAELVQAFTRQNPFVVDSNGFVAWAGGAEYAPVDHEFQLRTQGVTIVRGSHPNSAEFRMNAGVLDLERDLPDAAKVNGLIRVEGNIDADAGFRCSGAGFFRIQGGWPVLELVGFTLMLVAGIGALFTARPTVRTGGTLPVLDIELR